MLRIVDPRRPDADVPHAEVLAERGEIVIFRDRRQQHRADRPLLFEEGSHIVEHLVRPAVDGADEQREVAVLDRVEHAALETQHRLRVRSEEHTSELQSLMRISYAVFCLNKTKNTYTIITKRNNTI